MTTPEIETLRDARAAAERLAASEQALRARHRAALEARKRHLGAPEPVEDVIRNMTTIIDSEAARFPSEHGLGIVRAFSRGLELKVDGRIVERKPALYQPPGDFGQLDFRTLCGLAGDLVKTNLERIIRGLDYEAGLPGVERLAALEAANESIRAIEDEHAALVDAAASLEPPIGLRHLEAVARRRADEARRRQLEAERIADRTTRQDALDTAYDHAVNPRKTRAVTITDPAPEPADPDRIADAGDGRLAKSRYLAGESPADERRALEQATRPRPA